VWFYFSLFNHKPGSNRVLPWVYCSEWPWAQAPTSCAQAFRCSAQLHATHNSTSRSAPDAWAVSSVTSPDPLRPALCAHFTVPAVLPEPCFFFLNFQNLYCRFVVCTGKEVDDSSQSFSFRVSNDGKHHCCHERVPARKIPMGFDAAAPPHAFRAGSSAAAAPSMI
jgi:hypothetical protein